MRFLAVDRQAPFFLAGRRPQVDTQRNNKSVMTMVRMTPDVVALVRRVANQSDRSISGQLRHIVRQWAQQQQQQQPEQQV